MRSLCRAGLELPFVRRLESLTKEGIQELHRIWLFSEE